MHGTTLPDRYLTLTWNNALTGLLGVPTLLYGIIALSTSTLSDRDAFIGMVLLGAVY
jgi:hypothetical protein